MRRMQPPQKVGPARASTPRHVRRTEVPNAVPRSAGTTKSLLWNRDTSTKVPIELSCVNGDVSFVPAIGSGWNRPELLVICCKLRRAWDAPAPGMQVAHRCTAVGGPPQAATDRGWRRGSGVSSNASVYWNHKVKSPELHFANSSAWWLGARGGQATRRAGYRFWKNSWRWCCCGGSGTRRPADLNLVPSRVLCVRSMPDRQRSIRRERTTTERGRSRGRQFPLLLLLLLLFLSLLGQNPQIKAGVRPFYGGVMAVTAPFFFAQRRNGKSSTQWHQLELHARRS